MGAVLAKIDKKIEEQGKEMCTKWTWCTYRHWLEWQWIISGYHDRTRLGTSQILCTLAESLYGGGPAQLELVTQLLCPNTILTTHKEVNMYTQRGMVFVCAVHVLYSWSKITNAC